MSSRKFDFKSLTDVQLAEIKKDYPGAFETIEKPCYRIFSMMTECGVIFTSGRTIADMLAENEKPPFLKDK